MDNRRWECNKTKIIGLVSRTKPSIKEIENKVRKNTFDIFLKNKTKGFGLSLEDIKTLPPAECVLLQEKLNNETNKQTPTWST